MSRGVICGGLIGEMAQVIHGAWFWEGMGNICFGGMFSLGCGVSRANVWSVTVGEIILCFDWVCLFLGSTSRVWGGGVWMSDRAAFMVTFWE